MKETVRRLGEETEERWKDSLREVKQKSRANIREKEIQRIATTASQTSRLWLRRLLQAPKGPYVATERGDDDAHEREGRLYTVIPKDIFNLEETTGIRDRKIVIESLARGYDILLTNNNEQVKSEWLAHWLATEGRTRYGIESQILAPSAAYTTLCVRFGKENNWMVEVVGRASISDGYRPKQARAEVHRLMRNFAKRGMSEIARTVLDTLAKDREWKKLLALVQRHGPSEVIRAEQERADETHTLRCAAQRRSSGARALLHR